MMVTARLGLTLLVSTLAVGCAFSAVKRTPIDRYSRTISREQTVSVAPSSALDIAKSSLEAMGYEVQSVTPELGQVRTKALAVAIPDVCDCGTWNLDPVRGTADSFFTINVSEAVSGGATVVIEHVCGTNFAGQNLYGATTRRESYQCASRGIIEKNFWATFEKILQARAQHKEIPGG